MFIMMLITHNPPPFEAAVLIVIAGYLFLAVFLAIIFDLLKRGRP